MVAGEMVRVPQVRNGRRQAARGLDACSSGALGAGHVQRRPRDEQATDLYRELTLGRRISAATRRMMDITGDDRSLDSVLQSLIDVVVEALDLTAGAVLLPDGSRQRLRLRAISGRRISAHDGGESAGLHGWVRFDLAGRVIALAAPLVDYSELDAPSFRRGSATGGALRSVLAAPIRARGEVVGVVEFVADALRGFEPAAIELVEAMAERAGSALAVADLRERLAEKERQVASLLKSTLEAQDAERERIGLDLHDGVAQTLAAAYQYQQLLENRSELQDPAVRSLLLKTGSLVQRAIREVREVIGALRPAVLDEDGLVPTIRSDVESLRALCGWEIGFEADRVALPSSHETALYRIVHEAIGNARKHSRTSRLDVRVSRNGDSVVVEVRDYGLGFNPSRPRPDARGRRVGLLSMRRRAELLGGRCDVESVPGSGTTVRVIVPLPTQEASPRREGPALVARPGLA